MYSASDSRHTPTSNNPGMSSIICPLSKYREHYGPTYIYNRGTRLTMIN